MTEYKASSTRPKPMSGTVQSILHLAKATTRHSTKHSLPGQSHYQAQHNASSTWPKPLLGTAQCILYLAKSIARHTTKHHLPGKSCCQAHPLPAQSQCQVQHKASSTWSKPMHPLSGQSQCQVQHKASSIWPMPMPCTAQSIFHLAKATARKGTQQLTNN